MSSESVTESVPNDPLHQPSDDSSDTSNTSLLLLAVAGCISSVAYGLAEPSFTIDTADNHQEVYPGQWLVLELEHECSESVQPRVPALSADTDTASDWQWRLTDDLIRDFASALQQCYSGQRQQPIRLLIPAQVSEADSKTRSVIWPEITRHVRFIDQPSLGFGQLKDQDDVALAPNDVQLVANSIANADVATSIDIEETSSNRHITLGQNIVWHLTVTGVGITAEDIPTLTPIAIDGADINFIPVNQKTTWVNHIPEAQVDYEFTITPTQIGNLTIALSALQYWNTERRSLLSHSPTLNISVAEPARRVEAVPIETGKTAVPEPLPVPLAQVDPDLELRLRIEYQQRISRLTLAIGFLLIVNLALLLMLWLGPEQLLKTIIRRVSQTLAKKPEETSVYDQLLVACDNDDHKACYPLLRLWAGQHLDLGENPSMQAIKDSVGTSEFSREIANLELANFSGTKNMLWQGQQLQKIVRSLHNS